MLPFPPGRAWRPPLTEPPAGWNQLLAPGPWYRRPGAYPIPAYSEFMPAPRLGRRAYGGGLDPVPFAADDPWGWLVTEYEEELELRPGLAHVAGELLKALQRLGRAQGGHGIGRIKLRDNPFWPEPLASAGAPAYERYLSLAPLALARTQDDKGRIRWTLFGASEQGPARPFWRGFFHAPGVETSAAGALAFCARLVSGAAGAAAAAGAAGAAAASPLNGPGGGTAGEPHGAGDSGSAETAAPDAATLTRDLLAQGFRILPGGIPGSAGSDGQGAGSATGHAGDARHAGDAHGAGGRRGADAILDAGGIGFWHEGPLPSWTSPLLWREGQPVTAVRYLLTFRPFAGLPEAVRRAYLAGELHLLPFPGSLLFWGARPYHRLGLELPLALQIPLLHPIERCEGLHRLRVPQSGWLHEPHADHPEPATEHGPMRNTFRRTHRWQRIERQQDALAVAGNEDHVAHVLFSAAADDLGLYGKPMARNSQLWTNDYRLLLDGPQAGRTELAAAAGRLAAGGTFGYRFLYPAMRVGDHEVYWHRPLAAFAGSGGRPALVAGAPLGYLTAYRADRPDLEHPVELWPRQLDRPAHRAAIAEPRGGRERAASGAAAAAAGSAPPPGATGAEAAAYQREVGNARRLLDAWQLLGGSPLPESFAQALVRRRQDQTLAAWLDAIAAAGSGEPAAAAAAGTGGAPGPPGPPGTPGDIAGADSRLARELRARIAPATASGPDAGSGTGTGARSRAGGAGETSPLTFRHTANRRFEEKYWRRIAFLATGGFVNKDNADVVHDPATLAQLAHGGHGHRDLDALGDYLLDYYRRLISARGMEGRAVAGDLPFHWRTDFDFTWSGGWLGNQQGQLEERNLLIVIPGRDRSRAVIMADHYDTAYMEDRYGYQHGGHGPRLAAAGADDNHSATVALMLGAPIFLELSRAGQLACDVWLVHLTGEEFPSDCLGARHLTQALVEGTLRLRTRQARGSAAAGDGWQDLSQTRVQGVYVLDMIAHNNDRVRDVFQICPGAGGESMWLALQAHLANRAWNLAAPRWNRRARGHCRRGRRSGDGKTLPALALHPQLRGEVRPQLDPHSTLYNTDGQIFSDAGVPVVLFMENYDINRHGYHDSHDTMENIDLDYGAAVAAITIETVARAATEPAPAAG